MILSILLLAAAPISETPSPELLPSSKWQVEYAKSSCIISRAFGEGEQKAIFGLKPAPYSGTVPLVLIKAAPAGGADRGDAKVSLSGGFVPEYASYVTVTAKGSRVTQIDVPRKTLDSLAKGESITIKAGRWVSVTLRPTGFDKVMKAVDDCESDLLASWGFDKSMQAGVISRPDGRLSGVFKPEDYPEGELTRGIGGTVGVRLKVEPTGSVSECTVIESSGASALDKQTCNVAARRAHYVPAMGIDGKPVWAFTFERVTWMVMDM